MTQSDLDTLLEMGFDKERAELSVKQTGGLQGALEWLERNQNKPLDEIKAAAASSSSADASADASETAASLVCNECRKRFRNQSQAEFHAEKSGHTDFAESREEIAPLTEDEKAARLEELRERLKEKRAGMSEQDKADKKRNDEIRRKSTKETQDAKEELQHKEQIKEAEKKRREKAADIEAKEAIRRKIQADKDARRAKTEAEKAAREGREPASSSISPSNTAAQIPAGQVTSKPASAYTETRLRLQTSQGNVMKSFPVETTLFEVVAALDRESGVQATSFVQNFPRKTFDEVDFGASLKELGLVPSASLIVR
ncbi:MAG: hypothetical protein LQ340_000868 [Diploschistes diacapsis]|nr:MAG: hypothetical protein LQ340_000868 [Diploschistes diacapsis]